MSVFLIEGFQKWKMRKEKLGSNRCIGRSSKWKKKVRLRHLAVKERGKITTFDTIAQLGNGITEESIVNQGSGNDCGGVPPPPPLSSLPIRSTLS
ncbi:hypothetical protein CDAR_531801 [Caerostris darwini]|uniref:Uncharacterized protein n=1 Tax=Caerostris darwini TaxID=1538125 RepID=A0AAV4TGL9_9ARAC|nr:hypothetical protein CDAR_531801 [Caerostris darwini]